MSVANSPTVEQSVEELLDKIQPRLRATFARFRIPHQDAEDLLQQSLLTYLHKRDTIHDPERWMVGTVKNRCLMYWRNRRRQLYRTVDTAILESVAEPHQPAQEAADLSHDLDLVIARLPTRCRSLLRLRYRLGCEPPEAARRLGYRTSSIYKVLERCLSALTRKLVAYGLVDSVPTK